MSHLGPGEYFAFSRGGTPKLATVGWRRPIPTTGVCLKMVKMPFSRNAAAVRCLFAQVRVVTWSGSRFGTARDARFASLATACAGVACHPFLRFSPSSASPRGSLVCFRRCSVRGPGFCTHPDSLQKRTEVAEVQWKNAVSSGKMKFSLAPRSDPRSVYLQL